MATLEVSWAWWNTSKTPSHKVTRVLLGRKGSKLVTGAQDGSIWIWNIISDSKSNDAIIPYVALIGHKTAIVNLLQVYYAWTHDVDENQVLISVSEDG
jgi:WD40 repeat protein